MFNGGTKQFQQIPTVASGLEGTESSDVQLASKAYVDSILTGRELVAWVNFNGTGTVAIRASYNVSSITDNGTGDYTINFATNLPDTSYLVVSACAEESANGSIVTEHGSAGTRTVGSVRVASERSSDGVRQDNQQVNVAVFR